MPEPTPVLSHLLGHTWFAADTGPGHGGGPGLVPGVGPPLRERHHTGLDKVQAGEEAGYLGVIAVGPLLRHALVQAGGHPSAGVRPDIRGRMRDDQVTAGW